MTHILAIDQGTTSTRAILFGADMAPVASAQEEFKQHFPQSGWVEHEASDLWSTTASTCRGAIEKAGISAKDITAIGITNQRETTVIWDRKTGKAIHRAIVWQDRRTSELCQTLKAAGHEEMVTERTGLLLDPYFSATKLKWLLDNVDGARARAEAGELAFGTIDSWVIWNLTGGTSHVTDATNAARTMLYDIRKGRWSKTMCDLLDIPMNMLPEVKDSAADFGVTRADLFGREIPILGVAGDQQAALIGQACFTPGMSKSTYGTGCFVMTHTGPTVRYSKKNLLATIAYRIDGQTSYALEGSIFVAGQAVKWLRDQLGLIEQAADTQAAYERTGGDAQGVYVVPSFTGLGAPHWRPDARGLITGMTLSTDKDHIITAFLQSVVFQTESLLRLMAEEGAPVDTLRVDGGMVVNYALCQFLSDILQVVVERPLDIETTAKGAGVLAAIGCGVLKDLPDAATHWRLDKRFESDMAGAIREKLLSGYEHALQQALT